MGDAELERWAARHVPELIERAQAEALEVVRARLRERLAAALMEAAEARLATRPEPPGGGGLLWVYGAVGADPADLPPGVDGRPVGVHRHGAVAALVSEVPGERFGEQALKARLEDLDQLEALARAHEAVLQAAMEGGGVMPFRLCTIYASRARLDAMLEQEGPTLTAALRRLDGMQEWGVKAFLREGEPATAAPEAATGTEYLSRKRERREATEAERELSETVVAEVHARLAERAAAAVLGRPQDRRLSGHDAEMELFCA